MKKNFRSPISLVVISALLITIFGMLPITEASQVHYVKSGETLSIIARNYGVTVDQIAKGNSLTNPNMIFVNQALTIPVQSGQQTINSKAQPTTYKVQAGDTLYKISQKLATPMTAIIKANNLTDPSRINVGQVLVIPVTVGKASVNNQVGASHPVTSQQSQPVNMQSPVSTSYTVKPGDTLYKISQQFNVSVSTLIELNGIKDPNSLYVGQVLKLAKTSSSGQTLYLKGNPNSKKIALTFDDGPDMTFTPQVLDVLKKHNVPATFFLVGFRAEKHPEVVKRMVAEGHIIANHSMYHPDLRTLTQTDLTNEIQRTENILYNLSGLKTAMMRPPYGFYSNEVLVRMAQMNYKVINWSVDSKDWRDQSKQQILDNTLPYVKGGDIILLHSAGNEGQSMSATVEALPEMIDTLRKQGYTFVTVNELLGIPAYK